MKTSSVAFSKANLGEVRDAGDGSDAGLGTLNDVQIVAGKLSISATAAEETLCRSLNKKLDDKIFAGKCWLISLAVTA